MTLQAGVVAVQGDVSEHAEAIERAGAAHGTETSVVEIRESGLVPDCDALLLPGGESTTISRLVHREGIAPEIEAHVAAGKPLLATCAGLILLSTDANDDRVDTLNLLDVTVERNAFGRQRDSFEAPLDVLPDGPDDRRVDEHRRERVVEADDVEWRLEAVPLAAERVTFDGHD